MFAIITFANMYEKGFSKYSLSTQKTRLLTHLPRLWHKMIFNVIAALCVASNLPQATKVRECYENRVLWYWVLWYLLTKIGYFGTYLRYLPTNPTSHHCDNIPANPSWITDIFRYHFRISTSSSTVELVRFFLETLELVMHPCLRNSILSKSLLG